MFFHLWCPIYVTKLNNIFLQSRNILSTIFDMSGDGIKNCIHHKLSQYKSSKKQNLGDHINERQVL